MILRNNTSSRNSLRHLGQAQSSLSKTLEKLSSGYKINRSADDAAGLAISEKMRCTITGMGRAYQNSLEGSDLVQTAEGALEEIHAMLNRAIELADSSANGTYNDELDRASLQKELDQLCEEIDRIAKNTSFNTVKLFQDEGYEYESSTSQQPQAVRQAAPAAVIQPATSPAVRCTLDELLAGQEIGDVNIVYIERTDTVETDQSINGAVTQPSGILIDGKDLSDILKTEIIPNTVQNILKSYPSFSYLSGSSIGIGLEFFDSGPSGGSTTLAYVRGGAGIENGDGYMTYTLGVNTSVLSGITSRDDLQDLEATISHEMIHAFMDEAATAGMFGHVTGPSGITQADPFPDWFIEGMAQTASGPGNWLASSGGLHISASSTDDQIAAAISANKLGSGTTASEYGTGYLACMYLGAAIAGGGSPSSAVDAQTVSLGLTKLLNEVIGGNSLDGAINALTNGQFTSCSDFVGKFNSGSSEVCNFVRSLLTATGSGRGGIVSGDLTATDLTADTNLGDSVKLFLLNPDNSQIKNIYPDGYPIFSGGATSAEGTAPPDFTPPDLAPTEYGDLVVSGALETDITYDATTGVLTITSAGDIKISMKTPGTASSLNKIVLDGSGSVTLDGVSLSDADALTINRDVKITYQGKNDFGGITLDDGVSVDFTGTGQIQADTFHCEIINIVSFNGGAVIIGDGTGQIDAGTVNIDNAAVGATLLPDSTALESIAVPWDRLVGQDIAGITFDGQPAAMLLDQGQAAELWLDPNSNHRITFTDSNGVTKTLAAVFDTDAGQFEWQQPVMPFTVTGGTQGIDWDYAEDGCTLLIQSGTPLTISGGKVTDENGQDLLGRIKLADNIPDTVDLTLDGVTCNMASDGGCAFDLGSGNTVSLALVDGQTNTFTSGSDYAGISVGDGTQLTINGTDDAGLIATGGTNSAGIGSSGAAALTGKTNAITINGGNITASGGIYGAGIGAGYRSSFGGITINGGTIHANGNTGGAGIGGSYLAAVGDIEITGGDITAKSAAHGAGIGGGWSSSATNGTITISGGTISATSTEHGTGIGAGCSGKSDVVFISGGTIHATGGNDGAGIGSSWNGSCAGVQITGGDVTATGGNSGAGIGAGSDNSHVTGSIVIDTTGTVTATGGINGVGIGSGYGGYFSSSCGDIEIKQGTVKAVGSTDSTGIGAGRGSTSGNVIIGDPDNPDSKVVVDAIGGMTNNGGNIISYGDTAHTNAGTVTIIGDNTTVRPGDAGEGLYSTSGTTDENGAEVYAYPVYLFETDPPLASGADLSGLLPLPDGATDIQISATGADGTTKTWTSGLSHEPWDENYVFIWMTGQDQKITITYTDPDGNPSQMELDLKFYPDAGVFRTGTQTVPKPAEKPGYVTNPDPVPVPPTPQPPAPEQPKPVIPAAPPTAARGIILQIGENTGDTLEIPRFYLSLNALNMKGLDISTQKHAWDSIPILQNAINRVSSIRGDYGAFANRLGHNQHSLSQARENLTDAESRIRDADMAEEMMAYTKSSILIQSAQAMLAQGNQNASQVLQLLQ